MVFSFRFLVSVYPTNRTFMYKRVFGKSDDATRLNVLAVSKEADLKGGSSMTRGKSLSLVNDQDS